MGGLAVQLQQEAPIPLDIAFSCAPGELLALVGPSGSGKSTILRSIAGLHGPGKGYIAVGETVWMDSSSRHCLPTWARRVGLVPQSYALFPHLSAVENVMAAVADADVTIRRQRAEALLALVKLGGLEHRRPAELSGGQQQRVAVARALAREPDVLLLDEPFSAVDKVTRGRLYEELAGIRTRLAMPIVLVTHDLEEAQLLADRMCLVQRGRVVEAGPPNQLVERPGSVEAARLVGHRNIFPARILAHDGARQSTLLDWRGARLEAALAPQFPVGADVSWLIAPRSIEVRAPDQLRHAAAEADRSTVVDVVISAAAVLGDTLRADARFNGAETRSLAIHMPRATADCCRVAVGTPLQVSLAASAIHVMPAPRTGHSRR